MKKLIILGKLLTQSFMEKADSETGAATRPSPFGFKGNIASQTTFLNVYPVTPRRADELAGVLMKVVSRDGLTVLESDAESVEQNLVL